MTRLRGGGGGGGGGGEGEGEGEGGAGGREDLDILIIQRTYASHLRRSVYNLNLNPQPSTLNPKP